MLSGTLVPLCAAGLGSSGTLCYGVPERKSKGVTPKASLQESSHKYLAAAWRLGTVLAHS